MDKQFDFPVDNFDDPAFTDLYDARKAAKASLDEAAGALAAAINKAKRSPNKWQPLLPELTEAAIDAAKIHQNAQDAIDAAYEARRVARRARASEMSHAILFSIGATPFNLNDHTQAIRIGLADRPDVDILVWENGSDFGYKVAAVLAGTETLVRYIEADVYGPRQGWKDDAAIEPAYVSWSSSSQMDATTARLRLVVCDMAVRVLEAVNGAFGL